MEQEKLQANIKALKAQGAPESDIREYIKSVQTPVDLGAEATPTPGFLGKTSRVLGMEKLGQFGGAQLAKLDPQHRANLAMVAEQDPEAARTLGRGGDFTNRELLGSTLETAANIALPGMGKLLTSGSLAARAGKGAATGAGFGMAGGLESGQDNLGVLMSGIVGAGIGGAIPVAGAAIKRSGKLVEGMPERLYSTIFKNSADDVFKQLRTGGVAEMQKRNPALFAEAVKEGIVHLGKDGTYLVDETLAKQALDRGLKGSLNAMANSVVETNVKSELGLRGIVSKMKKPIAIDNKRGLLNVLTGIADGVKGQYDESALMPTIKGYIKEVKTGKVSAQSLLDMRRLIDSQRIASTYRAMPVGRISLSQESFKSAADALRSKLNAIPGVSEIMKDYSFSIEALEHIAKEAQRKGNNQVLSLIDSIFLAGAASGSPLGVGGFLARRSLVSPTIATQGAQAAATFGRATQPIRSLTGRAVETTKPVARLAEFGAIGASGRMLGQ